MTDREQADALARELVAAGAFRWVAGMLAHSPSLGPLFNPGRLTKVEHREPDDIPVLDDPATAAVLAVQAMEAGILLERATVLGEPCWRWSGMVGDRHWRTDIERTIGEAAARALLALRGGG